MTTDIQRPINTATTAAISAAVALNASTSTKVADVNIKRVMLIISNSSNQDVWLKLQATSTDDIKKGIFLPGNSYWEMATDNRYNGEVSAIAENGTPNVFVTEY